MALPMPRLAPVTSATLASLTGAMYTPRSACVSSAAGRSTGPGPVPGSKSGPCHQPAGVSHGRRVPICCLRDSAG